MPRRPPRTEPTLRIRGVLMRALCLAVTLIAVCLRRAGSHATTMACLHLSFFLQGTVRCARAQTRERRPADSQRHRQWLPWRAYPLREALWVSVTPAQDHAHTSMLTSSLSYVADLCAAACPPPVRPSSSSIPRRVPHPTCLFLPALWTSGATKERTKAHGTRAWPTGKGADGEDDAPTAKGRARDDEYIYNPLSTDPAYLSQIWPTGKQSAQIRERCISHEDCGCRS